MDESILESIRNVCNVSPNDTAFDMQLILFANAAINAVFQLGFGARDFKITGYGETWGDYLGDVGYLEMVKTYITLYVRKRFDPPTASQLTALDEILKELEFRINIAVDHGGGSPYE